MIGHLLHKTGLLILNWQPLFVYGNKLLLVTSCNLPELDDELSSNTQGHQSHYQANFVSLTLMIHHLDHLKSIKNFQYFMVKSLENYKQSKCNLDGLSFENLLTKESCSIPIVQRFHSFLMNFSCYSISSCGWTMRNVRNWINDFRYLKS